MKSSYRAFTIIELLMVIVIIALLAALSFALMGPVRESARRSSCMSNLRQIGQAITMYRADYDGAEAMAGKRMEYWQLGLPNSLSEHFKKNYIKDKRILFCPNYHGAEPLEYQSSTYMWPFHEDEGYPPQAHFSPRVEKHGDRVILVICKEHNSPMDENSAPRWATQRVLFLRLNGQVETKMVPVNEDWRTWE
jgi:prepilin-type N-terminal cleavage/methylation domain-containing protein